MRMKFPVLRFVWESRGTKMETVSNALREKWPRGYSMSTLQRLTAETMDEVPDEVAAVVLALPIQPGFEHKAQIVDAGLKALEGAGIDPAALMTQFAKKLPGVDPEVIARAIVAQLQAGKVIAAGDLEALASDVRGLAASVDGHAKREAREREEQRGELRTLLRRSVWTLGALSVAVGVGVVACIYPRLPAGPGDIAHTRGGGVAENAAGGGGRWDPYGTLVRAIAGEMGEHKGWRPMPHHPLPHQAVAPCQGSARTLFGSCWMLTGDSAPCPPDQYQEGQSCYIPLAADPNVPVQPSSEQPRPGQGEPTGEQPRPMQEMPGRDEH